MDVADFDIYTACLLCKLAKLYRNATEGDCKGHQLIRGACVGSVSPGGCSSSGVRGALRGAAVLGWGWGTFRAVGFAEQEGVSAGPQNAIQRNFLGIISATRVLGVPPAASLLP